MPLLPHQFTLADHTFTVRIDALSLRRVRSELDINLYAAQDDNFALLQRLDADPVELAAVLWIVCEQQARAANIDEATFFAGLAGDNLLIANAALWRGVADSFAEPGKRRAFHQILTAASTLSNKVHTAINERLKLVSAPENYTISFGKPPASPDSTQAPTPSTSCSSPPPPADDMTGTKPPSSGPPSPTSSAGKTPARPIRPTSTRSATTATTNNPKNRRKTTRSAT